MQFKNAQLNDRYRLLNDGDQLIEVQGYKGMLTDIPRPEIIDGMIARKSNLVGLKATTTAMPDTEQEQS